MHGRGHTKHKTTFLQQLQHLKNPQSITLSSKTAEHYQLMTSILNLMLLNNPLQKQLLILKQSISQFYDYVIVEKSDRNVEMMNLKDDIIVYVKQELGIILEQIGTYLKCLVNISRDKDLKEYYGLYLVMLKKIEWNGFSTEKYQQQVQHQETQTYFECQSCKNIPTLKKIPANKQVCQSADSPLAKLYNDNQQKYFQMKEQNLRLIRKNDQNYSKIRQLQQQNILLRKQIESLSLINKQFKDNNQNYLQQILKLKSLLDDLKDKQQDRQRRQSQFKKQVANAQNKFNKLANIQDTLHQTLNSAQQEILNKQQAQHNQQTQLYFRNNYFVSVDPQQPGKTLSQKCIKQQSELVNMNLRLLLIQASTIQTYIFDCSLSNTQLSNHSQQR